MRKILFGCALAVAALATPAAYAQNWCCPTQCDPCCDDVGFEGFYIGGNLGVHTHEAHRTNDNFITGGSFSAKETDFTIGLQLGYDWLCNNRVLGLVVDWNWVNTDNTHHFGTASRVKNEFDWFTTIRARAGLTVCDSLVYVTAGAAVAGFDSTWYNGTDKFHNDNNRWGWVGGAGAEFQLWCNWSMGIEVLAMHFSHETKSFTSGSTTYRLGHSDNTWVARVLFNYRFGDLCGCLF